MTARLGTCALLGCLSVASGSAQSAALDLAAGVRFTVHGTDASGAAVADVRVARTIALFVPCGTRPAPRVASAGFRAQWDGRFSLPQRDRYRFWFVGVGEFALTVDGKPMLDPNGAPIDGAGVRLNKGEHVFAATYTSVAGRDARVRLEWSSRRFAREPMPPSMFRHDPSDATLRAGLALHRGRELVARHRCVACHAIPSLAGHELMPELAMRGPDLADVGARLERGWLAAWLRDTHALRPDARMPQVLTGDLGDVARDAADLAAWLSRFEGDPLASVSGGQGAEDAATSVELGGYLFADLGCIGCHQIGVESRTDPARPIDLRGVGEKYRRHAMAAFLLEPARGDPWSRMPDFGLSRVEAVRLEDFLRTLPAPDRADAGGSVPGRGDAARGRLLAVELRCAACHDIPGVEAPAPVADLADVLTSSLEHGCLAVDAESRGTAPHFGLGRDARAALRVLGVAGPDALLRGPPAVFARRMVDERRCVACHELDSAKDHWTRREPLLGSLAESAADHGSEGPAVGQVRPTLTWAGDKLRTGWMRDLFAGRGSSSTRPWLRARMPTFSQIGDDLALGLAAMHGHGGEDPAEARPDPASVAIGQSLVSGQGGFSCVTCHAVGDTPPLAVFEVQGTNFATTAARLRPAFYERWMWNPLRVDPNSRMPGYADVDGRSPFTKYFDGDARAQFGAIWSYLHALR